MPVAMVVEHGRPTGDILYVHMDGLTMSEPKSMEHELAKYSESKRYAIKGLKKAEKVKLYEVIKASLKQRVEPPKFVPPFSGERGEEASKLYEKIWEDSMDYTRITLSGDKQFQFMPDPNPKKQQILYVSGPAGVGKSWIARKYIEDYHKWFPERGIYLISGLDKDETLDSIPEDKGRPKRIRVESLMEDFPKIDEFFGSLVIFDDIDALSAKEKEVVHRLVDTIATTGRDRRSDLSVEETVSMIYITHTNTNYKLTRQVLLEAQYFVVYPNHCNKEKMRYLLKEYGNLGKEDAQKIDDLDTRRWAIIRKDAPRFVLGDKECYIPN